MPCQFTKCRTNPLQSSVVRSRTAFRVLPATINFWRNLAEFQSYAVNAGESALTIGTALMTIAESERRDIPCRFDTKFSSAFVELGGGDVGGSPKNSTILPPAFPATFHSSRMKGVRLRFKIIINLQEREVHFFVATPLRSLRIIRGNSPPASFSSSRISGGEPLKTMRGAGLGHGARCGAGHKAQDTECGI